MDQGWVYVLVNSSIPGLVKVRRTTRSPADRALELSAATGVPTPFVVAFDQVFADCAEAERLIHAELDRRRLRLAPNREFFQGPPSEIIRIIIEVAEQDAPASSIGSHPCAERLLLAGDTALLGGADALQDTGEALRLYKLASARGSLIAFERMGRLYNLLDQAAGDRPSRRRTLIALKEGVRRGNYYCYCEMAALFAAEHHVANVVKCWAMFFAQRAKVPVAELETEPGRFAAACGRYIAQALELRVEPVHHAELAAAADAILAALLAELDWARGNLAARKRLCVALRWAYETLLPTPKPMRGVTRHPDPAPLPRWVSGQAIAVA